MFRKFFICFSLVLFSCKESDDIAKQNEISPKSTLYKSSISKENFDVFFSKFSSDSLFQSSRIKFPLRNEIYNSDTNGYEVSNIHIEKWKFFNIKKLPSNYIRKLSNKDVFKYVLNIQILDTGVNVDYIFMALNEKWILVNIIDSST